MKLHLDFETFSGRDLRKEGAHRYFEDPSTGVWCAAYAFDDDPVGLWFPEAPVPGAIIRHLRQGGELWAHNCTFERLAINGDFCSALDGPELPSSSATARWPPVML